MIKAWHSLPESAVPNRLYLCTDRYSPDIRVLPVIIRAIGFLLSKVNAWANWNPLTPSAP